MNLLAGVANFRDLGGLRTLQGGAIRSGRLFRSGVLPTLSPKDQQSLARLDIRLVADLRSEPESDALATVWSRDPDVCVVHLNVDLDLQAHNADLVECLREDATAQGAYRMMLAAYTRMPRVLAVHLPHLFSALLSQGCPPTVIHCTAGKDRTGFVSALLLIALGIPAETVFADYLSTRSLMDARELRVRELRVRAATTVTRLLGFAPHAEVIDTLMSVRPEFLQAAFDSLVSSHGSVDGYLQSAGGLTADARRELSHLLLE
jgi:protein-tyrosine phosphatase